MPQALDRPWHRPGAGRYAWMRAKTIVRPLVAVVPSQQDIVQDRDVAVPMRDGIVLRVNIFRPNGDGPFPVLLCAHPYGKDKLPRRKRRGWSVSPQYRIMRQVERVTFSDLTGWEGPDPSWWVAQGYAVVNADLRGAGTSEGDSRLLSDQEGEDVYDLIGWAAGQDWSTGSVGLIGVSYLAISQYKAAAMRPPTLRAICPWEGFTDAYRDLFTPGGIVEAGFSKVWQLGLRRATRSSQDFGALRASHPLRDEWWESLTPDLPKIEVPMLICTSFSDNHLHSRGSFRAFQQVRSPDRFAYTHRGGKWSTFYSEPARQVQLDFFDRYLKGRDIPPPARMRLEVRESGDQIVEVRHEQEWPLARTAWRSLFLADSGALAEQPLAAGSVTFHTRRNAAAFTYTVGENLELTGPMSLRLWVSVAGADDVSLIVGVEKWRGSRYVPFEGSYGYGRDRITTGWLRASLRELDEAASTPYEPVNSLRTEQPLSAGEIVRLDIALGPSATKFRAGDSLRLLVAGRSLAPRNPLTGHFPAHYVPSARARVTLHWSPAMPAALVVPVIPRET